MTTDPMQDELDDVLSRAESARLALSVSTPRERAGWLDATADALDAERDGLVALAAEESHLTAERLVGELRRTTFQLRLFGERLREGSYLRATIDHADPGWPMGPRPDLRRWMRPIGIAAVFTASNFPFAFGVGGGDTAAALAAGCPVVVKGHSGHPRLSRLLASIIEGALSMAGAPDGVFALVHGTETGRALVRHPLLSVATFTGSLSGGRALFDLANARPHPIPFYGELGSVNPAFVTEAAAAARPDAIAEGFAASMTMGVGQFCTKPGVLFVPRSSPLQERIEAALRDRQAMPMLNDRIRAAFVDSVDELAEHIEVTRLTVPGTGADPAPVLLTTGIDAVLRAPHGLLVECFGPAGLIVQYEQERELLAVASALEGQLTATVHAQAGDAIAERLVPLLADTAGRVLWNEWPTGVSVTDAMQHGGPYPATTAPHFTSVGTASIERFLRPVAYQNTEASLLPPALREDNPWSIPRTVDGRLVPSGSSTGAA